jgi:hypothetical protein
LKVNNLKGNILQGSHSLGFFEGKIFNFSFTGEERIMTRNRFHRVVLIGLIFSLMIFTSLTFAQNIKPRGIEPPPVPYCETPCEITGAELTLLVNLALSQPDVDQAKEDLEDLGYSRKSEYDYGEKQDSAQTTTKAISIAFGIDNDSTRAAYIIWICSNGDTNFSVSELYFGDECPFPGWEEIMDDTWFNDFSATKGYGAPSGGFWRCWGDWALTACSACAGGCVFADGAYLMCLAKCCAGVGGIGGLLYCGIKAIF